MHDTKNAVDIFFSCKNLFITLTYSCNVFCEKCLTRYHKFKNKSMDLETLNKIIDLIIKNNYRGIINIGSGEALTYKYIDYFISKLLNSNDNLKFRILSNGVLLNAALPKHFFDNRIIWGVTLDGFVNNDLINLQKGVDLELVKNNICKLAQNGYSKNLYLNYTLNNQNFHSLKNFIDFANACMIKEIYVTEMKIFEGFEYLDKFRFDTNKNNELLQLEEYAKSLNFSKVYFATLLNSNQFDKCYCKNHVFPIIDLDGSLSFCYGHEDRIIGNIFEIETIEKWFKLYNSLYSNSDIGTKYCYDCSTKYYGDDYLSVPKKIYTYLNQGINENKRIY